MVGNRRLLHGECSSFGLGERYALIVCFASGSSKQALSKTRSSDSARHKYRNLLLGPLSPLASDTEPSLRGDQVHMITS